LIGIETFFRCVRYPSSYREDNAGITRTHPPDSPITSARYAFSEDPAILAFCRSSSSSVEELIEGLDSVDARSAHRGAESHEARASGRRADKDLTLF